MKKRIVVVLLACTVAGWVGASFGQGCFWDDSRFFTASSSKPNAFILLDRSGSMEWCIDGSTSCSWAAQNSRLWYAVQGLKAVLDGDGDGVVEDSDEDIVGVNFGYGYFTNSNQLFIPANGCVVGTPYSRLWQNINSSAATGGTPLDNSIWMVNRHLSQVRGNDPNRACRPYFGLIISDGADNQTACLGANVCADGDDVGRYFEMHATNTAFMVDSIKMFMVGLGANMPQCLRRTLEWAAYKGKTDNPAVPNTGDSTQCIARTMNHFPGNSGDPYCSGSPPWWNTGPDPKDVALGGRAFIASSPAELAQALRDILKIIQESVGSTFSPPSVPANFTSASMLLVNNFDALSPPKRWKGHLGAFAFWPNGDMPVKPPPDSGLDSTRLRWDAGNLLRARNISNDPRLIYTPLYQGSGSYTLWPLSDTLVSGGRIRPESLGLANNAAGWDLMRTIVNYMYYDSVAGSAKYGWMGDPFHAGPVDVGPPNPYFSSDTLFNDFVYYLRTLNRRARRVYLQTNDGMIHVFNGDSLSSLGGGREICAIVPRHARPWLQDMLLGHDYNLDGPLLSTHVLVPALSGQWQGWRTILVCGERTGGRNYYALDVTRPDSAVGSTRYLKYLWEYGANSPVPEPNMGYTFGVATVSLVKDSLGTPNRRYVAFLPGGYDCAGIGGRGKGYFVLALDAYTGQLLNKINLGSPPNDFGVAAQVRPVDLNYDGFVDRLYVGDVGGTMWRIILDNPPSISAWHARKMFQPNGSYAKPIFGEVSVAADYQYDLWIMWGTGNRNEPMDATAQNANAFFGIQDLDTSKTYAQTVDLDNVTNAFDCNTSRAGWWVDLYRGATNFKEVFTNAVTVSDTVRVLGWSPDTTGGGCAATGAGVDTLLSYAFDCGAYKKKESAGRGIPPYELAWGVDNRGNVTVLLPNLKRKTLGTLNRGKFIRVWREVY